MAATSPAAAAAIVARLQQELGAMAAAPPGSVSDYWRGRAVALSELARTRPAADFLSWSLDVHYEHIPVFDPWYAALRADAQWPRWERLSRKEPWGNPHPFRGDAGTTPVSVQHAYHLHRYEAGTGERFIAGLGAVFEVGGGYGNFCRMLRKDGFAGEYIILDLPHTQAIQRAYLALCGVPATLITEAALPATLARLAGQRVGFVSTFGLSETPLALRDKIFPALYAACAKYLLAVQWPAHLPEPHISNEAWFSGFMLAAQRHWHIEDIAGFAGHRYLFGLSDSRRRVPLSDACAARLEALAAAWQCSPSEAVERAVLAAR